MQITFLIGNGFDRNLGLATTYAEFVNEYKKETSEDDTLKKFHSYIKNNEELWSNAEIAIGEYTAKFEAGNAEAFSKCHTDFCEKLAVYLTEEMNRIDYGDSKEVILAGFSNLNQITSAFPTLEREILDAVYTNRSSEQITFNFICFNYTDTLDNCLSILSETPDSLGFHRQGGHVFKHSIGQLCHVHGTTEKEMVFGVNDESQISKPDIFDCEDGDIYKNMLIKIQANASFLENTDSKAARLIQSSSVVYIYGMSIGDTDKLWWDRICTWLNSSRNNHLIVQKYAMPPKKVVPTLYQITERKLKKDITKHSSFDDTVKSNIETRIHITGENIFRDIENIAKEKGYKNKKYLDVLQQIKSEEKELANV